MGNSILAIAKIILGLFSNSLSVLSDGIDSATDVLTGITTVFVSKVIEKPGDHDHPWGHTRAETVATLVLSFMIFMAGVQIIISSIKKIFFSENSMEISILAVFASVISILGKLILLFVLLKLGKKSESELVKANALNMKQDIILSASIFVGVSLSKFLHFPILDSIFAFFVGAWILKNGIMLFLKMNLELMDGNADSEIYDKLFAAALKVEGVSNPHSARIRNMAGSYDIDLDIEVSPELSIFHAHELSEQVEENIRAAIPNIYALTIHIEPTESDSHQPKEVFGLRPREYSQR